jgi:protein-L-isoaspartate(D-aspartate) O-methyltransferase
MNEDIFYQKERERMVREQLASRTIRDPRVLSAMQAVPREWFVPPEHRHLAYADGPLPIGQGQTISQPFIVALMTQLLELQGEENVLEVGTGSGYQAAVLAHLAKSVHTIERHASLARAAVRVFSQLRLENIHTHIGDGTRGYPEAAPFDGIIVTAAAPEVPQPLLDQLADGGRLVIPVGARHGQYLQRWRRMGDEYWSETLEPVAFVPLLGEHGWEDR